MHSLLLLLLARSIPSFIYIYQFYRDTAFIISNLQKDFYQVLFVQLSKYTCRYNFWSYTSKGSIEMTVKNSVLSSGTFKPRKLV